MTMSGYKYIFWQNILSIHQAAFLRSLSENNQVLLVVEQAISQNRLNDGWFIPDMGNTHIEIAPDKQKILSVIEMNKESIHVFSGINVYKNIQVAFEFAIKRRIKSVVISESGNNDFLGSLRKIRTIIYRYQYSRHIDCILAMGNLGVKWYTSALFRKRKIFPFLYTTEVPVSRGNNFNSAYEIDKYQIIVIAQCIRRKGIDLLLRALKRLGDKRWQLKIIGDGIERNNLKNLSTKLKLQDQIDFLGSLSNEKAMELLGKSDLLVLPSRFDGWGAVVNEALLRGIKVIASANCGASCLLNENWRGSVFLSGNSRQLATMIGNNINEGSTAAEQKHRIRDWSLQTISSNAVVNYFTEIMHWTFSGKTIRPIPPWST